MDPKDFMDFQERAMEMRNMQMDFLKRNSGAMVFGIILSMIICGIFFPYTVNAWLTFVGKPAAVKFWQGALVGLVPFAGILVPIAAVLTFIILLFL